MITKAMMEEAAEMRSERNVPKHEAESTRTETSIGSGQVPSAGAYKYTTPPTPESTPTETSAEAGGVLEWLGPAGWFETNRLRVRA